MAVTKTHPIKRALKAAIDYICNPEKTDGKLLVSSYGCAAETADIEFAWTRRHAIDKGTNLGRHLIQAFQPGEVTTEQAHEIGMELAREILGGRYEFVLTTHIDRDHVHNHLIFNAVSFADHKHYHSNKRSYHFIRRTSDRICKEHGLSVIVPGQERFTRLKTLGADYAEDALTARMAGRARPSRQPKQQSGKISLLIDIQNNIKAQQSAGYRHWATIENLKRIAETSNFLTERCEAAAASVQRLKAELRETGARREEQDYAAVRRNVEEFLSPPRQVLARQKDMELECPLGQTFCRPYRRLRPCLAAAGGGVVCAADAVPPADGGLCVYHHRGLGPRYGNVENGRFADGKRIHGPMEKPLPFPQPANTVSHSAARLGRLPTVPQRLRLLLPQKSRSLIEKIIISW